MFQTYFRAIQEIVSSGEESTELSFRTCLYNLMDAFLKENIQRELIIQHEPAGKPGIGRPDFKVITKHQLTIGIIETKRIEENLKKILDTEQLARYKQFSDNIMVTDYLHFYIIRKGEPVFDYALFSEYNLDNKKFKVEKSNIDGITKLFKLFFEAEPDIIYKTSDLSVKLADKAILLREYSKQSLKSEQDDTNLLQGLYKGFRESILHQITEEDFADIYAQTITYSLFLAALNCDSPANQLNTATAFSLLPKSFPLIKELFHRLDDFPKEIVYATDEIISILKVTDFSAIKKEFAEYKNKEKGFSDPFIFFYEDFLKHYDKTQRKLRGVYYTPEPVVSYIVKSLELIIKDTFGLTDGFINKSVTLLDFATGTGTFLLFAFKLAIEQAQILGDKETVNKIINEQIIENFYGFELLIAPYVISHLKISEYFKENGYSLETSKRLKIYITNTLTNKEPQPFPSMPSLSKEGKEANNTKNKEILVIMGNPPYSGHSANVSEWIDNLMKNYYVVDGKKLKEKNPKWLQDDYVKFIRFAQWKMEKAERGVVGIITNHSYLDNPTFRGMRQSLMNTFDEIYIMDLHGNSKKKEKSPDGSKDENVFDIQQGVAIAIFVKRNNKPKVCKIFHADLFGVRESKYSSLWDLNIKSTSWQEVNPKSPFYLFKPRNEKLLEKYNNFTSIKNIFNLNGVVITTAHDDFVIDSNRQSLINKFLTFKKTKRNEDILHEKFNVKKKLGWDILKGYDNLQNELDLGKFITSITYRPFDNRFIFLEDKIVWRAVRKIQNHFILQNIGLCVGRQWITVGSKKYDTFFVTSNITDINLFRRGGNVIFPLFVYQDNGNSANGNEFLFKEDGKRDNFTKDFRNYIKNKYINKYSPEEILAYIYAVLHSPTYRTKYIEFLKIDFPRIPFCDDEKMFRELSNIGSKLTDAHLMKVVPEKLNCRLLGGSENFKVEKVTYDKGKVWFNKEKYFDNIPQNVWEFQIGGYQVLDKWLKERKKLEVVLTVDDIKHFINVVNILSFTIDIMNSIDELTREWI